MVIMAPKDESELRNMLYTAIKYKDGPIAIRYPRGSALGVELQNGFAEIPIGKGERIRSGEDVALLAVGNMVEYARQASVKLESEDISCEIINMRFIKPLDSEILDEIASRFDKIVTIEESTVVGGFGSGVLEYLNEKNYKNELLRIGLPDNFVDHGTQEELHKILGIDPAGIAEKVKNFLIKNINQSVVV
jgi:1-deoxy-D-xylulose-5-phosphate synthase